jgi:epoxyqueuosine reductase
MGDGRAMTAVAAPPRLEQLIKAQAYGIGFDLVGITSLGPAETYAQFDRWIASGYAGDMAYLERGAEKRKDTRLPLVGTSSAIVVGLNYGGTAPSGPIARYARGDDYHEIMWSMLDSLKSWISEQVGHPVNAKSYVDTGPILERDLARRAGLGWFGKNTNLIHPQLGSFFFIGSLFVDLDLEPDAPFEADRCGTCTRCLDACPTGAIVEPRIVDATRCVSYLTIETRGGIPPGIREDIGELLYGCDICQDVCPWNVSFSRDLQHEGLRPRDVLAGDARTLARSIIQMSETEFREIFRGSPMKRAKMRGLKRNAAVVLGNAGNAEDVTVLKNSMTDDEPMVREHAQWAIDQIVSRG